MRLITSKGQLDLPADFSFSIEQQSPVFSREGTQSIPATVPTSVRNLEALGYPTRIGRSEKYLRKMSAKVEAGVFQKDGQLVIDSAMKGTGIVGAVMLNESDLYTKIKDVKLQDVFIKIIRDDFANEANPIEAWYNYLMLCMTGAESDDFTLFPVAVNYNEASGYGLLNSPDHTIAADPWPLRYKTRRVTVGDETQTVPDGYGITPFLWMWRVIELLFAEWNYTIGENPFKSDAHLAKIALLNNTADSICVGKIRYSDLVPSCTVSDFLTFLENKFLCHAYIYPESKTIDIGPLQSVLTTAPDADLSSIINGEIKHIYSDPKEVSLSSDTSLEGAAPAMPTIFDFNKKYKFLAELDEFDWRNNAYKYTLVKRLATGEYFEILRKMADSSVKRNRLGTNYFTHFTGVLTSQEYKADDIVPPMVEIDLGLIGAVMAKIVCPFIGDRRHVNTEYNDDGESEQKIIVAMAAGHAESDVNVASKAYLGTTQKYNNLGHSWADYDLTTFDLYNLFFKAWNSVLRNSAREIECRVDYPIKQLLSLRLDRLKLIQGQKVLQKSLSYTVGKNVLHNTSSFVIVRPLSPIVEDIEPSFELQLYMWSYVNNADTVFAEFDTQEWDSYTWVYVNPDGGTYNPNTFEFIPPPTAEQFAAGGEYYRQENDIRISAKRINSSLIETFDRVLISYFTPIEIV